MITRSLVALLTCLALLGCSGGSNAPNEAQAGCTTGAGEEALCLTQCNLGCSSLGCTITDIAQNQPIILVFNQDVDPTSVSPASVSLRTASGEEPVGRLLTNGSTVTFVPEILVVGTSAFLGFKANETYTMTLPGGPEQINTLRSITGDIMGRTVTCTLAVTRGIVDLDGKPPSANLVSPAATTGVDPATSIVLEFSEIIDITAFLQTVPGNEPVVVGVSQPRVGAAGLECNPTSISAPAAGRWEAVNDIVRQVTVATFFPEVRMPSAACITVEITSRIRDLSGKPAQAQFFRYVTIGNQGAVTDIAEDFSNDAQFDAEASSGTWVGGAKPGQLGWDGLHGEFDPVLGRNLGNNVFEWNTDDQTIPGGSRTLSGNTEVVNDGVFRFSKMVVPAGVTVRFIGSKPARIFVRGTMQVDGTIDFAGRSRDEHPEGSRAGQAGGAGGAGGGDGGKGAEPGDGIAHDPLFDGADGEDVVVMPGHAFESSVVSTGGRGVPQFPASGKNEDITLFYREFYSSQVAASGAGAGMALAGTAGIAAVSASFELGPPAAAGVRFAMFDAFGVPASPPAGVSVLDHYLVGGAGGGGSGSHPYQETTKRTTSAGAPILPEWHPGTGGGGGGGAFGSRIGRDLVMSGTGLITARGGDTATPSLGNYVMPGGGGSGGSIILQIGNTTSPGGLIDVTGGIGGVMEHKLQAAIIGRSEAGHGAQGYYRIEAPGPLPVDPISRVVEPEIWTGSANPPAQLSNIGVLAPSDTDAIVGLQSKWYRTEEFFPPSWLRYEVRAIVDGQPVTYSDDPAVGIQAGPNMPVQFLVQGASPDLTGTIPTAAIHPWRRAVGRFVPGQSVLDDDAVTAFRFLILFDRPLFDDAEIEKVTIFYRPFN